LATHCVFGQIKRMSTHLTCICAGNVLVPEDGAKRVPTTE
jgi:hypothetical protein